MPEDEGPPQADSIPIRSASASGAKDLRPAGLSEGGGALWNAQRFFANALDALSAHIAILDESGKIMAVNGAWRAFAAENDLIAPHFGVGTDYFAVCAQSAARGDGYSGRVLTGLREVLAGGRPLFEMEYPCHGPAQQRWFALRATAFIVENRKRLVVAHEIITERVLAEQAMRESEERYRMLIEGSHDLIQSVNPEGRFLFVNESWLKTTGYSRDEVEKLTLFEVVCADDRGPCHEIFARAVAGERFGNMVLELVARDGSRIAVEGSAVPLLRGGVVVAVQSFFRDLTERRLLETELLEISEARQRRIGQDLHDGLFQEVAGVGFMSLGLARSLAPKSPDDADRAARIGELLGKAVEHARELVHGLSPVLSNSAGLMAALDELAATTQRAAKIECRLRCADTVHVADAALATHLFRVAQEAVTNALQHAHPRWIEIALSQEHGEVTVRVSDDGVGIGGPGVSREGLGLRAMRYRAEVMRGALTVQPRAGGGTEVICAVQQSAPKPSPPGESS